MNILDRQISKAAFGRLVGLSPGRVTQLAQSGVLKADDTAGGWVLSYCAQLRNQASGRAVVGPLDLSQERARLASEQADIARMKRLEMEGSLLNVAAAEGAWAPFLTAARQGMLNVAARLAPLLASESNTAKCHALIDTEMRATLAALSDSSGALIRATKG